MSETNDTPKTAWTKGPEPRKVAFQEPLDRGSVLKQVIEGVKELAQTFKTRKQTKPGDPYSGLAATSNGNKRKAAKTKATEAIKGLDVSGVKVTSVKNIEETEVSKDFKSHW